MTGHAEDRSIVIAPPDKGSCVIIWNRKDYLDEMENDLKDTFTYKEVKFSDECLVKLVDESYRMYKRFLNNKTVSTEEFKYFCYNFKKATNLGKMYLRLKGCIIYQIVLLFLTVVYQRKKHKSF